MTAGSLISTEPDPRRLVWIAAVATALSVAVALLLSFATDRMTDVTTPAALGMVVVLVAYLVSWLVRLLRFGRLPVDLEPLLSVTARFLLSSLLVAHFDFAVGSFCLLIVVLVGLLAEFNVSRLVHSFVYVVLMMVFVRALFGVMRNAVIVLQGNRPGRALTDI